MVVYRPIDLVRFSEMKEPDFRSVPSIEVAYPFSIQFSIGRGIGTGVGNLRATIYNLGQETRNHIYHDIFDVQNVMRIQLFAGYGDGLSLLFDGRMLSAYSTRRGTEIVTEMEATETIPVNDYVELALPEGISQEEAIIQFIDAHLTYLDRGEISVPQYRFKRGFYMSGSCAYILKRLADGNQIIDRRTVRVLGDEDAIDGIVPLIDSSTGLLGTPKRYDSYMRADVLFDPTLILGQLVNLRSRVLSQWNGQFKIFGLTHSCTISPVEPGQNITSLHLSAGDRWNMIKNHAWN